MEIEEEYLPPEKLPFDLTREIGAVKSVQEFVPGVYYLSAQKENCAAENFYVVMECAVIFSAVSGYGQPHSGLRVYALNEDAGGWRIVEYELSKCRMSHNRELITEETEREFHRVALFAAGYHPEYFGEYPVPTQTPGGYTLCHRKLENGVYWLETSRCEEMLAVCYPIWNTEFTSIARVAGKPAECDYKQGFGTAMGSLFYSRRTCCVAFYELLRTRPAWEGTVVDKPALMNAIWKDCPKYAVMLPQLNEDELENYLSRSKAEQDEVIGMYPEAGEDFLLFLRN